jgi:hypothetical protein
MVELVVAGLSKKLTDVGAIGSVPFASTLVVERGRDPAASPIEIGVEFLISCIFATPLELAEPFMVAKINILLVADDGVIETDRPVMSVKTLFVEALNTSVLVVLTTCTTWPGA